MGKVLFTMNNYELYTLKPDRILRHGGPRDHQRVGLVINGKIFEIFYEDSQSNNWSTGKHFDAFIKEKVKHLMSFFPGRMTIRERLNMAVEEFIEQFGEDESDG